MGSRKHWKLSRGCTLSITVDSAERKDTPIYSGFMCYFPDAIAEVARLSMTGNQKHNPGQPLHWDKTKSTDHLDCISRHLLEAGVMDTDGHYHDVKIAWRAMANLQLLMQEEHTLTEWDLGKAMVDIATFHCDVDR